VSLAGVRGRTGQPARRAAPGKGLWRRFWSRSNERSGYLFILPASAHLVLFLLVPIGFSL
jgi:multiple sugar transport system permease protein